MQATTLSSGEFVRESGKAAPAQAFPDRYVSKSPLVWARVSFALRFVAYFLSQSPRTIFSFPPARSRPSSSILQWLECAAARSVFGIIPGLRYVRIHAKFVASALALETAWPAWTIRDGLLLPQHLYSRKLYTSCGTPSCHIWVTKPSESCWHSATVAGLVVRHLYASFKRRQCLRSRRRRIVQRVAKDNATRHNHKKFIVLHRSARLVESIARLRSPNIRSIKRRRSSRSAENIPALSILPMTA